MRPHVEHQQPMTVIAKLISVSVVVLVVLAPGSAMADELAAPSGAAGGAGEPMSPPELTFPSDSATSPIRYGTFTTLAFGPVDCVAKANNPHVSTSANTKGRVKATMQNKCKTKVPNNSVEAKLWQKRWWGFQKIAGPKFSSLSYAKVKKVSPVGPKCDNGQTYRLTGYGHYSWNGTHYVSSEKFNTKKLSC